MTIENSNAAILDAIETPEAEVKPVVPVVDEKPSGEVEKPEPQTFELKLPEGSLLPTEHFEKVKSWAQENKISQEDAEKALERDGSTWKAFHESQAVTVKNKVDSWPTELKQDKDFGGDKFNETVSLASRVLDHFGDASFKKELNESGLGNHPGLLKWAARVGRAMKSDELVVGKSTTMPERLSTSQVLYGSNEGKK